MDRNDTIPTQGISFDDYFENVGCRRLAHAILLDSIQQVVADPEHKLLSTQFEIAWLKGDEEQILAIETELVKASSRAKVKTVPPDVVVGGIRTVSAQDVFETLNVGPEVAAKLIDLAVNRPEFMAQHIKALDELIDEPQTDFRSSREYHAPMVDEDMAPRHRAERAYG